MRPQILPGVEEEKKREMSLIRDKFHVGTSLGETGPHWAS